MKRGATALGALSGDYGKVRPVLIIQSDRLADLESVVVCPMTSDFDEWRSFRVQVNPSESNGLEAASLIMIEKLGAIDKHRIRRELGTLEPELLAEVDEKLAFVFGLAD